MIKKQKLIAGLSKVSLTAASFFLLTQCSPENVEIAPDYTELSAAAEVSTVESLTISGVHTVVEADEDCKTCTIVVPVRTKVVDGTELNIKPGDFICLDKALKYGNLEFVNFIGEENKPIVIGFFDSRSNLKPNSAASTGI
jgi:hypothetical protein